ncbi:hybrid sensor histidine kinase/response regulator [uncultured Rhodoblastus sp.]|uniref:ATP-binding response regulator n=1 Tax=uncultured Rhodoblastus sp. TaxID=543037 RepID=UPI0025FF169E|nr:hybrid sensor histidine kinase/response regulator [uncultured Rhodoblastus sp.]
MPREVVSDRIRAEQIRMLYGTGRVGVIAAAVSAFLLAGALQFIGSSSSLGTRLWLAYVVVVVTGHLALCRRFWRAAPADAAWRPWALGFVAFSGAEGAMWALASAALTTPGQVDQQLLVLVVAGSVAAGALAVFGTYLPAFYALLFPFAVPYAIAAAAGGRPFDHSLAILFPIYIVAFAVLGRKISANLVETLRLRFENEDLARELRIQKEAAEQANIAKSSFLAAASHDLRQPVHALSLLVGALQGHAMSDEMRGLVEHIGGSVAAMDGLFNSLLDISRLDAGVVKTSIEEFAIQPLLARVCRDYGDEAETRGLGLVLLPCSAIVRSDPVLIERILRNLVANALRYTESGRVVVGCRRRNGLRIEVWDTGRGIPPDQQQQIFREFYQLANSERDRAKGLGLGLAIVDRLAKLLDCRLSLKSAPGKGSVFRIVVPLAHNQVLNAALAPEAPLNAMPRGLILVIDDDAAIQGAMASLLSSWGHEVVAAGSLAEMLERVETSLRRPDLLLCDYRLRDGENGIDVIRRLQSEYNEALPAVLITGDTAPDRLREARESGLILLHKPVTNIKLRATVGNLIRANIGDRLKDAEISGSEQLS